MHRCEWCGTESKTTTCGSPHRGARWRFLKGIGTDEPPWRQSPLHGRRGELDPATLEEARVQGERDEARAAAERAEAELAAATAPGPRSGSNARSGTMISYRKAVGIVAGELLRRELVNPCTEQSARIVAETWLREALPPRIRKREASRA